MKCIKELAQYMKQELCDAKKYAKQAMKYKDQDNKLAQLYYQLSKEQIDHAMRQHKQVQRLIKEKKVELEQQGKNIPQSMMAVWKWQHEHMIDEHASILALLSLYK